MEVKNLKKTLLLAIIMVLILLVVLSSATFAWFSFTFSSVITPMSGTVNGDGVTLLISNDPDGPFEEACDLKLINDTKVIYPVSTVDLREYYVVSSQNKDGIATSFVKLSDDTKETYFLHGVVYLYSQDSGCDVFLNPFAMNFGDDIQALSSLRLGLVIKDTTVIFSLDDYTDTSKANGKLTVEKENSVFGGEKLVADPAESIFGDYSVKEINNTIFKGNAPLANIDADTVCPCEYWLYLEGCDENCINDVQLKDVAMSLAFSGFTD